MKKRTYQDAIERAWDLLQAIGKSGRAEVDFLGSNYRVDFAKKLVENLSESGPVREYYQVLILHYLAKEKAVAFPEKIEWVGFQDLESGKFYYSAFSPRSLDRLDQKFSRNPKGLWENARKLAGERLSWGDLSFKIRVFPKVFVAIVYWGGDEEVSSRYDLLFNREIGQIFSTEDSVVLAQILVGLLSHPG